VRHFENAVSAHRAADSAEGLLGMLFQLGMAFSHLGDSDRARATCREALDLAEQHHERWGRSYALWVLGFDTWRAGDTLQAEQLAEDSLLAKSDFSDHVGSALIIELLAWIASSTGAYDRAAELLGAADVLWRHLGTSIEVFGPQLGEQHQQAAETTCRALGQASFDAVLAEASRGTVELSLARALGHDPAAQIPAASPLTPREWEIAEFIHRGLTSKQIAAHLFVSARTVDSHVEHIRGKLGLSSRAHLAAWFAEHGSAAPLS
jgi:DNA-binding CsgD family transcriptional regulator